MLKYKYRVAPDWYSSRYFMVQCKRWWFPFWIETNAGFFTSHDAAKDAIVSLKT